MSDEKKIIIDEDWKSQVEAEREALSRDASPTEDGSQPKESAPEAGVTEFPPASFDLLVTMLATEAMVALGQMPHPATQKAEADIGHARYIIDMLEILSEKTKGNLESSEEQSLKDLLYQLRMVFVSVKGQLESQSKS